MSVFFFFGKSCFKNPKYGFLKSIHEFLSSFLNNKTRWASMDFKEVLIMKHVGRQWILKVFLYFYGCFYGVFCNYKTHWVRMDF